MKKYIKKITVVLCMCLMINSLPITSLANDTEYTTKDNNEESDNKESDTPPNMLDFTDPAVQEDVWNVFKITTWTDNRISLNFMLGSQGVAFSPTIDSNLARQFQDAFEKPLGEVLRIMDEEEKQGKVIINTNHKFKCVEYQKIVSCILYCMIARSQAVLGRWAMLGSSGDKTKIQLSFFDIFKEIYTRYDVDQSQFINQESTLYLEQDFIDYWLGHGYTEDNIETAFWEQLGLAYFGRSGCTDLMELTKVILEQLTMYDDGVKYKYYKDDVPRNFYFDVYDRYNMLNYVCLDSLFTVKTSNNAFGYETLFEKFMVYAFISPKKDDKYGNLKHLVTEWDEKWRNGALDFAYEWGKGDKNKLSYTDFRTLYLVDPENRDCIPAYSYPDTIEKTENGMDQIFISNFATYKSFIHDENYNAYKDKGKIDKICSAMSVSELPGGSCNEPNYSGFGQFYYKEYAASKIAVHTINGKTGEEVREED